MSEEIWRGRSASEAGVYLILIVDRFEGEWAVLEWEGQMFNFPRALLPKEAAEGDVLRIACKVDPEATRARRRRIKELQDELFDE